MALPRHVTIVEVGPRDGLQNEPRPVSTDLKVEFIDRLSETGLSVIETTSFVRAPMIPQLADARDVQMKIRRHQGVSYPVLIPNEQGLNEAMACDVQAIALFSGVSEQFLKKNTNCSIKESLSRASAIMKRATRLQTRAYISCALGCPYQGRIFPQKVLDLALSFLDLGVETLAIADTIGMATAKQIEQLLEVLLSKIPAEKCAVHFHNTYGQALTNIYVALQAGIRIVDSAIAGLGGCPYAKGARGNVPTEELVYFLEGLGIEHGVDLDRLVHVSQFISKAIECQNASQVTQAWPPHTKRLVMMKQTIEERLWTEFRKDCQKKDFSKHLERYNALNTSYQETTPSPSTCLVSKQFDH